ncbi:cellulase family glycosylhydrolase [Streptomyces fulvorobeus]|uniref:Endoglucanase n=1 Tax=Streptomyces fulvorobeus TaxID=284028 RepID=A0A7J0CGV2_9ACTN|nr:cellulase family glycosylhydrolase [Streptomyces fulvorobeus]NYE44409.1 mannan endo-1,4-beta-mannosidase [Streptomyces fulvorobeus]GFN00937.1 endoglucanase [Streptomyces fulvorobeus]
MRTKLATAAGALLAVAASMFAAPPAAQAAEAATGFHVSAGRLLDANGNDFVLRGVNHAHTWYPGRTAQALADVKALGANSVRVVLSTGDRWTKNGTDDVKAVVAQCKANRLICVLEPHDTTGYGEQAGAVSLDRAVDYWTEVQDAVKGQEKYVILNLGNEPHGNSGYAAWTADTSKAIGRMRTAGFDHTLMADAPNWGQDWSFTMRDNAPGVFAADPMRNTVFSIHMYGVFDTAPEVSDYLNRFVSRGLPVVVGEFGDAHSDGNPDEDAILATAERLGLGYLGWSWSGNGGGVEYLDMATGFDASRLSPWGQRIFNGPNGIKQTAEEASVFGTSTGDTQAPTGPGSPSASEVTSSSLRLNWAPATDNTAVTAYDVVRVDGTQETRVATTTTPGAALTGLTPSTRYTFAVYARDAAGNRSPRSATLSVTTPAGPVAGSCAVTYRLSDWGHGFNADVTIRNTGTQAVKGWRLDFAFPGSQTLTSSWNAKVVQDGKRLRATNEPWNETIPAGGTVSFGMSGTSTGANGIPAEFLLNSSLCQRS